MPDSAKKEEIHEKNIESKFGDDYNHPHREELKALRNDEEFKLPHRHLTKWYLTKRGDEEPPLSTKKPKSLPRNSNPNNNPPLSLKRRYPLPENYVFDDQHELRAYMVVKKPSSSSTNTNEEADSHAIPIVLTDLKRWEIDKSSSWRGIWVKTKLAWYYLKDPCHIAVPRITYFEGSNKTGSGSSSRLLAQDPYLPAQSSIHMPLRTKLGLLSNLIDMLMESSRDSKLSPNHYASLHAKQSIEKSYKMLCFDSHIMKKKYENVQPPMNDEPFDLLMLKQKGVAEFIKIHIRGLHFTLSDDSSFIKSLTGINESSSSTTKQEWRENDYRQSALKAEKRSRRESWCEPLANIDEVRPNQLIELEGETNSKGLDAKVSKSDIDENSSSAGKSKKDVEGTALKILGGDTNHILVLTEKSSFDEEIMIESIENLSAYLLPKPTEEDKKKSDYTKFSIEPSKVEEFLRTYVLNEGVLSLELMLLVVSAITRSSDKVMKHLFRIRKSDDSKKTAGSIVFRYWLSYSISVMEKRRHRFSRIKPQMGQTCTEELIAAAIMNLISKFHVIKSSKQINTLKDKYFVDWVDSVEKTFAFANAHNISDVIGGCKSAMERLESIESKIMATPKRSTSEVKEEQKKSEPDVKSSPADAKRLRLARMIEESSKRNKNRSDGNLPAPNGAASNGNDVSSSVKKIEEKAAEVNKSKPKPEKKGSTNGTEQQKGTYVDNERLSRKEEDGLSGLPLSLTIGWKNASLETKPLHSLTELEKKKEVKTNIQNKHNERNIITDSERLSRKEENGLAGLPIYGGWKNSNTLVPSKDETRSTQPPRNISKGGNMEYEKKFTGHNNDGLHLPSYTGRGKPLEDEMKRMKVPRNVNKGENVDYEKRFTSHGEDGLHSPLYTGKPLEDEMRNRPPRNISKGENMEYEKRFTNHEEDCFHNNDGEDGLSDLPFYGGWKNNSMSLPEVTTTRKREQDNSVRTGDEKRRRITPGSTEGGVSRSMGRGRGKDINKPAWLTRQESNKAPVEADKNTSGNLQNNNNMRTVSNDSVGGAGRGRGRGRGRDINKPAWMTKQESNGTNPTSVVSNKNAEPNVHNPPQSRELPRPSNNTESRDSARGRGRGKHINKPAWLTKQESNVNSYNPTEKSSDNLQNVPSSKLAHNDSGVGRGRGRGRDINKPAWLTKQESTTLVSDTTRDSSDTRQSAQTRKEPSMLADSGGRNFGTGRSRGRGKDINKPAWLTKQESNTSLSETSRSVSTNTMNNHQAGSNSEIVRSNDVGVGRGRGLGKDINRPAWLTKQENTTRAIPEPARNYSNNGRQQPPPSSGGGGRGRGTDNRPAWMTRQNNNSANSNNSRYNSSKGPGEQRTSWIPPGRNNSSTNGNSRGYR